MDRLEQGLARWKAGYGTTLRFPARGCWHAIPTPTRAPTSRRCDAPPRRCWACALCLPRFAFLPLEPGRSDRLAPAGRPGPPHSLPDSSARSWRPQLRVLRRSPGRGLSRRAGIAILNWLAGGGSSAYEDLFVLWAGAGAAHPPRRALLHLLVPLCALALPLLYESTNGEVIGDMLAEGLILVVLDVILIGFSTRCAVSARACGPALRWRAAWRTSTPSPGSATEGLRRGADRRSRTRRPREHVVAVGLVDVDNLKRVNDNFGHLEGDRCLRDVARAMERSVRKADRCFRWGGDEFVVVLPSSNRTTADSVLVRLADAVTARCERPDGRPVNLTWAVARSARVEPGGRAGQPMWRSWSARRRRGARPARAPRPWSGRARCRPRRRRRPRRASRAREERRRAIEPVAVLGQHPTRRLLLLVHDAAHLGVHEPPGWRPTRARHPEAGSSAARPARR